MHIGFRRPAGRFCPWSKRRPFDHKLSEAPLDFGPSGLSYLGDIPMAKEQKDQYEGPELIGDILKRELEGRKFTRPSRHL